jgi:hypothetical protein
MKRHEIVMLVFALALLVCAWELTSDPSPASGSWTEGQIPWSVVSWQFRHTLAPAFASAGLASVMGILFLRAAQWRKTSALQALQTTPEVDQTIE